MIHSYKITSTGISGSIDLSDLGLDPLTHPVVNFDLVDIGIEPDEIENSEDLYAAIQNGVITAVFDDFNDGGIAVTSANLDKTSVFDDPAITNTSGEWVQTEATVAANSADWDSAYSTVEANSADWALSGAVSGGGTLVKMYQGVDSFGGLKITNDYQYIPLTEDIIKDDYYSHSTSVSTFAVTILSGGWYDILATTTIATIDTSQGNRGRPVLVVEVDAGSGFVAEDIRSEGYVSEDAQGTSTNITYGFYREFNGGEILRLGVRDIQTAEPNEETIAYGTHLKIEYKDRTGSAAGTVENLKDIGDVEADAPNNFDTIRYNSSTGKWESFGFHDRNIDGGRADTIYFVNNIDGGGAAG